MFQCIFVVILVTLKLADSRSRSPDYFVAESVETINPYHDALKMYLGQKTREHERLRDIYIRLNPRGYIDWDGGILHRNFDDPIDSE